LHHKIIKKISCDDPTKCGNTILQKLETEFNAKLHATDETDTVDGSLSIYHKPNDHQITIVFYDKDEKPNMEHLTTLHKHQHIPSEKQCEDCLK